MKYTEIFKGLDTTERTRRMEAIEKMNKLWDRRNACLKEEDKKAFDRKINRLVRQEAFWLREIAWFLY